MNKHRGLERHLISPGVVHRVRHTTVAAAVAAALASSAASAGQPTPAQAASPTVGLYIAGASAPRPAVLNTLENSTSFCGGSYSLFSSTGDTNFYAVSCTPAASTGLPSATGTNVFTIWYRAEGGSVVGALPLVSGSSINQLALAGASGSGGSYTVAVGGSSATNGIDDSFAGGVFKAPVQMGLTDEEPVVYTGGNNYPSASASSARRKMPATAAAATTPIRRSDAIHIAGRSSCIRMPNSPSLRSMSPFCSANM